MTIAFFGSSLVSAYWNGAATYYRGIIRALADRGHRITFFEPDAFESPSGRVKNPCVAGAAENAQCPVTCDSAGSIAAGRSSQPGCRGGLS
jgi:spore maturation protein CgeB